MRSFSFAVVLAALSSATATIVFWDKPGCTGPPTVLSNYPVNQCDPFEWRNYQSYTGRADPLQEVDGYYNFGDCVAGSPPNVTIPASAPSVCHDIPFNQIRTSGAIRRVPRS